MKNHASDKWWCNACRKTAYGSESRGWEAIHTIYRLPPHTRSHVVPCRVYECPYHNGWHLTSHRERSYK